MKWLKNVIKNALREFIKEDGINLGQLNTEHFVLDPDKVNVITVDCGQMPQGKAREYLLNLNKQITDHEHGYKIVLIAKRS